MIGGLCFCRLVAYFFLAAAFFFGAAFLAAAFLAAAFFFGAAFLAAAFLAVATVRFAGRLLPLLPAARFQGYDLPMQSITLALPAGVEPTVIVQRLETAPFAGTLAPAQIAKPDHLGRVAIMKDGELDILQRDVMAGRVEIARRGRGAGGKQQDQRQKNRRHVS